MKEHIKLIPYSTLSGKKLEAIKALSKYSVWDPENEDTLEEFWGWEDTQKYIEDNHLVITI